MKRANWNHVVAWATMFAILGSGRIRAESHPWASIGPQGGEILALSIDPHNRSTVYAATAHGGAFKSLDGGESWVNFGGPDRPLIFDPQDPDIIYSIDSTYFGFTCGGITKSTDGGKNWIPANAGLPASGSFCLEVLALAIDPHNPSALYAGTSLGIFKSMDGGASWISSNSGLPKGTLGPVPNPDGQYPATYSLTIDPQNPSTIYAVVNNFNAPGLSLFKSTDGGGSWSPAGSGLPESRIVLAIDPQNPSTVYAGTGQGVFKTIDGGANWSPVNSGLPPFLVEPYTPVNSVVIDPLDPAAVYVAFGNLLGGKVFKSVNAGASWSDASSGLPEGAFVSSLQIDPQIPAVLYAGTTTGVFKSADGGTTWRQANSGLVATWISDVAIDPRNSSTLYAATSRGLVKTIDGGANWSPSNSGLAGAGAPLAIDPQNKNTVFAAGCIAVFTCGLVKSADGGTTWSASWIAQDFISNWITALAIDPQNSNLVYMTTQGFDECGMETLYESVDGGVSWSHTLFKDLGVTGSCVLSLAVDPQNSGQLYTAFQRGGVFKSTDAGATWNESNSGLMPGTPLFVSSAVALAIDPASPTTIYTVSASGVFKSADGGINWNSASLGLPDWSSGLADCCFRPRLAVDPTNSARVYLGIAVDGAQHVFQSSDSGASWIDSGLVVPGASLWFGGLAISAQDPSTVYAGTPNQGLFAFSNAVTVTGH
jgi:photosystem II stability/assembly factor-like uncharacterized protein